MRSQELQEAFISFVMSVCLSVYPHETFLIPLNGYPWQFILENFTKTLDKIQFWSNRLKILDQLHDDPSTFFFRISRFDFYSTQKCTVRLPWEQVVTIPIVISQIKYLNALEMSPNPFIFFFSFLLRFYGEFRIMQISFFLNENL